MQYLTIWADYRSTGVRNSRNGPLQRGDLIIGDSLWNELQTWVASYALITLSGAGVTNDNIEEVRRLDTIGLSLAKRIGEELKGAAKVEYFSEGLLSKVVDQRHLATLLASRG